MIGEYVNFYAHQYQAVHTKASEHGLILDGHHPMSTEQQTICSPPELAYFHHYAEVHGVNNHATLMSKSLLHILKCTFQSHAVYMQLP